jgi:hypothetical protein
MSLVLNISLRAENKLSDVTHCLQLGLETEQVECLGVVVVKHKCHSRGESMYGDPKPCGKIKSNLNYTIIDITVKHLTQ